MVGSLTTTTFLQLVGFMVGMWILQFALTYRQMRGFYGRLKRLRQHGLTAVGLAGDRMRGRAYGVLVVDDTNRVVAAEAMYGWTVFSGLRPIPALIGMPLTQILADETALPVLAKLQPAFGNAARTLAESRQVPAPALPDTARLAKA